MPNERLILGAMSGTSADGVDVALTHITGRGLEMQAKLLAHAYHPYTPELRKQILEMRQRGDVRLANLAAMGRQVTLAYVEACRLALKQGNVNADQVAAIAAHGQTLFHGPPNTIQYFDPSLLAYETGIAVVSDFRRADLAAGGQGAPLVPFADWILFRDAQRSRVLVNIGGIANITYLKSGGAIGDVIAFDCGPGNCLSDWLCREHGIVDGFDDGGRIASYGVVIRRLVDEVIDSEFVNRPPPKTTDGPEMVELFKRAKEEVSRDAILPDLLATANMIVARTIVGHSNTLGYKEYVIAGGGARNQTLMLMIADQSGGATVKTLDQLGVPTDAREALAFALLGAATLDGEPSNVPSATGASRRVVLGSTTPKP